MSSLEAWQQARNIEDVYDHHPDDEYPQDTWEGQLCPYTDCCWWCELWAEGWYQCPHCGRYFYACESDSDYEDWKCYRDGGPMGNAPAKINVVAGDRGPSWEHRRRMQMDEGSGKFESDSLTEAYFDRNQAAMLAASLAEQLGDGLCAGWKENPDDPDWPILYINLPQGQVSWHIPRSEQVDFGTGPWYAEWDGHDLAEKRRRIDAYLKDW